MSQSIAFKFRMQPHWPPRSWVATGAADDANIVVQHGASIETRDDWFGELVWGILITILGVVIGSQLFTYYLQTFADYKALYAGLAGIMVAIIYLYCLSILILFGMATFH